MQVIAHNMLSQFTSRQLNITDKNKSKSSEKLSSGYRINRAGDDAAGLAISEKMRWQIRGLNRGKQNICDGISLVQTAEGALHEVHSILQRVRELSLQAYNDTNTRSDREKIQAEIDMSIEEIGHIADTTMFNTKYLLRGNPTEIVQVTEDTPDYYYVHTETTIEKPAWLVVDPKIEVHGSYNQAPGNTDGVMFVTQPDGTVWYYGEENPNITDPDVIWYGNTAQGQAVGYSDWNSTIADNATAKIDFKGLLGASSLDDLYLDLFSLLGTQLRFPCGTCNVESQGVFFCGSAAGVILGSDAVANTDVYPTNGFSYSSVNLSSGTVSFTDSLGNTYTGKGYFELIDNVTFAQEETDEDGNPLMTDAQKSSQTAELASFIAKHLRDRTYNTMANKMNHDVIYNDLSQPYHFDRVLKTAGDDYSLIVYDYRDSDKTSTPAAMDSSVGTIGDADVKIEIETIKPGQTVLAEKPLLIMAGPREGNNIPISLPKLSALVDGLRGYSVSRYKDVEHYSTAYAAKMQDWLANGYTYTNQTMTYTTQKWVVDSVTWKDGERKATGHFESETSTRTVNVAQRTPRPLALPGDITIKETYMPDSLWDIDKAIDYVSTVRAELGATQNRLEHAYCQNEIMSENSQSSESRIRDTDMAAEMVNLSKHSILQQAGQAMLAQANQLPNGVLQLLQ